MEQSSESDASAASKDAQTLLHICLLHRELKRIADKKPTNAMRIQALASRVAAMKGKLIVGVDPGKNSVITAAYRRAEDNKIMCFTYTQSERLEKSHYKRLQKRHAEWSKAAQELMVEMGLDKARSNTTSLEQFLQYMALKLKYDEKVQEVYGDPKFRCLRYTRFRMRQKAETAMVMSFEKKLKVDRNEVVLAWGAWSHRGKHGKGSPPIAGKCLLRAFKRSGFQVELLDEFQTSKSCSACGKYLSDTIQCIFYSHFSYRNRCERACKVFELHHPSTAFIFK